MTIQGGEQPRLIMSNSASVLGERIPAATIADNPLNSSIEEQALPDSKVRFQIKSENKRKELTPNAREVNEA